MSSAIHLFSHTHSLMLQFELEVSLETMSQIFFMTTLQLNLFGTIAMSLIIFSLKSNYCCEQYKYRNFLLQ